MGFVYVKEEPVEHFSVRLLTLSMLPLKITWQETGFDWGELKGAVRDDVAKFLFDQTKRRPAILPVVMEVR